MPVLAKGKTVTGHIWTYVPDDRPFGGQAPPAGPYYASRDRRQEYPERHLRYYTGILQADAYGGYNGLYDPSRVEGAITPPLWWAQPSAWAAEKAAPYMPPRLAAVEHSGDVTLRHEDALEQLE